MKTAKKLEENELEEKIYNIRMKVINLVQKRVEGMSDEDAFLLLVNVAMGMASFPTNYLSDEDGEIFMKTFHLKVKKRIQNLECFRENKFSELEEQTLSKMN